MIKVVFSLTALLLIFSSTIMAQDAPVTTREAAPDPSAYTWTEVASGLSRPLYLTNAGDGSNRMFVVEQSGQVHIIRDGQVIAEPFIDISAVISQEVLGSSYTERGLLGLAFHPLYEENGRFFLNYTDLSGNTVIASYQVSAENPDSAEPASGQILLTIQQPFPNHNGGQLQFGPDGYLYIGMGDGGAQGDPFKHGQNPATLLGKLLRIDVDSVEAPYGIPEDNPYVQNPAFAPEVWAQGLRNPWRFSFDRATGDLYVADVGQNAWEEVNFQPVTSTGGDNYGWNLFEATHAYTTSDSAGLTMPIAEYDHALGCSISGGYVYRGEQLPELQGVYFYGDWCSGIVWNAYRDLNAQWQSGMFMDTNYSISSFGEDEAGELYILHYNGALLKLTTSQ